MAEASEQNPAPHRLEVLARRWGEHLWRVIVTTVGSCLRHRVTGLAAEAAFFAVLSVPPLVFALAGAVGFVSGTFTETQVDDIRNAVLEISRQALTDRAVNNIIEPTIRAVLDGGRYDVISIGSSSRCGRARARSTSSSTPSRSCTASAGTAVSSRPGPVVRPLRPGHGHRRAELPLVVAGPTLVDRCCPPGSTS